MVRVWGEKAHPILEHDHMTILVFLFERLPFYFGVVEEGLLIPPFHHSNFILLALQVHEPGWAALCENALDVLVILFGYPRTARLA